MDELEVLTEEEEMIGVLEVEITTAVLEDITSQVTEESNANVSNSCSVYGYVGLQHQHQ